MGRIHGLEISVFSASTLLAANGTGGGCEDDDDSSSLEVIETCGGKEGFQFLTEEFDSSISGSDCC